LNTDYSAKSCHHHVDKDTPGLTSLSHFPPTWCITAGCLNRLLGMALHLSQREGMGLPG